MNLTDDDKQLLSNLVRLGGSASSAQLPHADRAQDRARQKCKRHGLVRFEQRKWTITDIGRATLAQADAV